MPRLVTADIAAGHAREAETLQAEAARADTAEAGALLVEAANQWRLAGDATRCRTLLAGVIAQGGEAGCFARAELVGLLLETGPRDAVAPELAALAADPALSDGPCQLVAELLTDHGSLADALEWYDRAVAHWDGPRVAAGADRVLLEQRRRIRKRLGLAP
jgi:hypothetical protein